MPNPIKQYLKEIEKELLRSHATEHTHRPALKTFIESFSNDITASNEPKKVECGAPDFIITSGNIPIGYIEAKDVDSNLNKAERSEQLTRYRKSLSNLILTDYLEFRWYVNGEHQETVRLASVTKASKIKRTKKDAEKITDLLQRFLTQKTPTVVNPKDLAQRMAAQARMIKNLIEETFSREAERGMLHAQLKAFQDTLIPDLTPEQFADMYAQTITYGLFAARVRVQNEENFSREKAAWNLPKTNPFLRKLFNEIAGPDLDDRIAWLVDDLARLMSKAKMTKILKDFGKSTWQEDPIVHFYETFLSVYDPEERQTRGVYYTPEHVVSYIVRSLDHIVKNNFDRPLGLGDTNTFILDPAVGTATFLYFVIQHIHETLINMGQAGSWNDYVSKHLLPRVFGFELLMAPYAVAHMKLGVQLQQTNYDFKGEQRLGIYLTNTLEEAILKAEALGFAGFITEEANAAADVKKEKPIMVILGNPPYSVSSANKGKHIESLMKCYKTAVRHEQNIQPLSDDYIKFIRFAHDRIERTGHGVIGMITNHTYLSGLIHRGMREELMKSFSEIYILNLHGSALLGETAPDGSKDENVFDIRQGVAISIFVRKQDHDGLANVQYSGRWGLRKDKYDYLLNNDVNTVDWQIINPEPPNFFFVPKTFIFKEEYDINWSIIEIFQSSSTGFETGRDKELIKFSPEDLTPLLADLTNNDIFDEEITERYDINNTSGWPVFRRRGNLIRQGFRKECLKLVSYRPFDQRYTYYHNFLRRAQFENLQHLCKPNIALITSRIIKGETPRHVCITTDPLEKIFLSPKTSNNAFVFPLYLYPSEGEFYKRSDTINNLQEDIRKSGRIAAKNVAAEQDRISKLIKRFFPKKQYSRWPNINPDFIAFVEERLSLSFIPDGKGSPKKTFGPEDILYYAYAILHSPTYRERYAEFLKIDFPRLPITSDLKQFKTLSKKGEELASLHLMESPKLNKLCTSFPISDSNEVVKINYVKPIQKGTSKKVPGRVYINQDQYFEGVEPKVWEFKIGGYQILHKWLKDRKGRMLSFDDTMHYQKVVVAIKETIRLMEEIDNLIPSWPIK